MSLKRIIILMASVLFITPFSSAQICSCVDALQEVAVAVEVAPSYKDILNEKGKDYIDKHLSFMKDQISKDSLNQKNCSAHLQRFLRIFLDKHLSLTLDFQKLKINDAESYQKLIDKTAASTPVRRVDTNSIFSDSIEGYYEDPFKRYLVVVRKDRKSGDHYSGVIVKSTDSNWRPGQVKFSLEKINDHSFGGIFYDETHFAKYYQGISWSELFFNANFQKQTSSLQINPYYISRKTFDYEKLNDSTDYIYLGSFYGSYAYVTDQFYDSIIPLLKGSNLIIDVRNNRGGGPRMYEKLLKHLRSKANAAKKMALIQNKYCGSSCEHFTYIMLNSIKAETYGEPTSGAMAYGYGNTSSKMFKTGCFDYLLEITETKYPRYKQYEFSGIVPNHILHRDADWVKQVVEKMNN